MAILNKSILSVLRKMEVERLLAGGKPGDEYELRSVEHPRKPVKKSATLNNDTNKTWTTQTGDA